MFRFQIFLKPRSYNWSYRFKVFVIVAFVVGVFMEYFEYSLVKSLFTYSKYCLIAQNKIERLKTKNMAVDLIILFQNF